MTWLLTLWPKVKLYALLAVTLLATLGIAIAKIRASGAQKEKLNQLETKLEVKRLEAKIDADLSAATAASRRDSLRQRWLRR